MLATGPCHVLAPALYVQSTGQWGLEYCTAWTGLDADSRARVGGELKLKLCRQTNGLKVSLGTGDPWRWPRTAGTVCTGDTGLTVQQFKD